MAYHRKDHDGEARVSAACKMMKDIELEAMKFAQPVPVTKLLLPDGHPLMESSLQQVLAPCSFFRSDQKPLQLSSLCSQTSCGRNFSQRHAASSTK